MSALLAFPFYAGETFVFKVKYGFISAGTLTLQTVARESLRGYDVWHFRLRARGGVPFYRIDDLIESWARASDLASVRYFKRLREGSYRAQRLIDYFPDQGFAVYSEGDTVASFPGAVDPLSIVYYARTLPLEVGASFKVPYHVDRRSDTVEIRVLGRERVRVPYGEFDCFVVEPVIPSGKNIFGARGGLKIWLTANEERLPVKIVSKVFFGSMSGVLVEKR